MLFAHIAGRVAQLRGAPACSAKHRRSGPTSCKHGPEHHTRPLPRPPVSAKHRGKQSQHPMVLTKYPQQGISTKHMLKQLQSPTWTALSADLALHAHCCSCSQSRKSLNLQNLCSQYLQQPAAPHQHYCYGRHHLSQHLRTFISSSLRATRRKSAVSRPGSRVTIHTTSGPDTEATPLCCSKTSVAPPVSASVETPPSSWYSCSSRRLTSSTCSGTQVVRKWKERKCKRQGEQALW